MFSACHPPIKGCHSPKLILAPSIIRMIVTLRTIQTPSHEDAYVLSHNTFQGPSFVGRQVEARGAIIALSHKALTYNLIIGLVPSDATSKPFPMGQTRITCTN